MQRNWIGKSSGHGKCNFPYDTTVIGEQGKLKVIYYPALTPDGPPTWPLPPSTRWPPGCPQGQHPAEALSTSANAAVVAEATSPARKEGPRRPAVRHPPRLNRRKTGRSGSPNYVLMTYGEGRGDGRPSP